MSDRNRVKTIHQIDLYFYNSQEYINKISNDNFNEKKWT